MAFLNGFWVEKPNENAPDFVIAKVSLNVTKLMQSLSVTESDFINLQIKESKKGQFYAEIDDWQPKKTEPQDVTIGEPDDLPF